MKFSVALCTYEGTRYLDEQLQSIAAQSHLPDEMVVFDDHSGDDTVRILQSFASAAPFPVRVHINDRRLGTARNFEQAIRHCSGEIIALADQDDVWRQEKVARLRALFLSSPGVALAFSDARVIDQYSRPLGYRAWESARFDKRAQRLFRKGQAFKCLLQRPIVTGATMAFRSCFRDLILPFPEPSTLDGFIHDAWIALAISSVAPVAFVDEVLIDYRSHPRQQTGLRPPVRRMNNRERDGKKSMKGLRYRVFGSRTTRRRSLLRSLERLDICLSVLLRQRSAIDCSRAIRDLESCVRHFRARLALLEGKDHRARTLLREILALRYQRHSNGLLTALADLLAAETQVDRGS